MEGDIGEKFCRQPSSIRPSPSSIAQPTKTREEIKQTNLKVMLNIPANEGTKEGINQTG